MKNPLIVILGPTASGKTNLSVALAHCFCGEIISADSRQIFKGMDLGTGKDLSSYQINKQHIPYHLIDILSPGQPYHVNAFLNDFYTAFNQIIQRKHMPLLCGGTGMYLQALLQNYQLTNVPVNQVLRSKIWAFSKTELIAKLHQYPVYLRKNADESTTKRLIRAVEIAEYLTHHPIPKKERTIFTPLVIGLNPSVTDRRAHILQRLNQRLAQGLVQEVQGLLDAGISKEMLIFYGLEYKFVTEYLAGAFSYPIFKERLATAIYQYAKRQMTFFRKMERDGIKINWLNSTENSETNLAKAKQLINAFLVKKSF